jgi:hypothetical protein
MNVTGSVHGAGFDDDGLGADPFTRFLLDNPQAIPHVMGGLERVVADLVEEQTMAAQSAGAGRCWRRYPEEVHGPGDYTTSPAP